MVSRLIRGAAAVLVLALAGCATTASPPDAVPWHDAAFSWEPSRAAFPDKEALFRLDAGMEAQLASAGLAQLGTARRLDALMALVFGADRAGFGYVAGDSTTAQETWRRRRGDCISLTILTYAAAKALGLQATMQEVRVPTMIERRAGLDYVSRHVNVLVTVRSRSPIEDVLRDRQVVIDFEPEYATPFRGRALTDDQVLARFHNNLGAEALARGETARAYAHFRAAITADPAYAAAHANLALLYQGRELAADAEKLLRRAIALTAEPEVPLATLHRLLAGQGRHAEAETVARQLRARQEGDPYYWIGEGARLLAAGDARRAVSALERAQALSSGFGEVHRYLAVAWFRLGERQRAQQHLAQLASLDIGGEVTAKLRRKFSAPQ